MTARLIIPRSGWTDGWYGIAPGTICNRIGPCFGKTIADEYALLTLPCRSCYTHGDPDDYEDGWDIWEDRAHRQVHVHRETGQRMICLPPDWDPQPCPAHCHNGRPTATLALDLGTVDRLLDLPSGPQVHPVHQVQTIGAAFLTDSLWLPIVDEVPSYYLDVIVRDGGGGFLRWRFGEPVEEISLLGHAEPGGHAGHFQRVK